MESVFEHAYICTGHNFSLVSLHRQTITYSEEVPAKQSSCIQTVHAGLVVLACEVSPPEPLQMAFMTASPNSDVLTVLAPGEARSAVRTPAAMVSATAFSIAAAASGCPKEKRSIIATQRICAAGLATPLPAMSGAEPPDGSYMLILEPSEAEGIRPSEPGRTDAASESTSPKRFSVTITSKADGFWISCIAALSTYMYSTSTSGWFGAISCATLRQSREVSSTLALSTTVSL
mmetsp:Transcript_59109/g.128317  ORF Transcript_59109/g.128317 Transcript_59109/m.128317 type:complete len:233 (+) Transcript_59109:80-778(+)